MKGARFLTIDRSPPRSAGLSAEARTWQRRRAVQLAAAAGAVAPMLALGVWIYLLRDETMTITGMLLGPLLGGGSLIFWLLALHIFVCGDELSSLGFRLPEPWREAGSGVILGFLLLGLHLAFQSTIAPLFPRRPPAEEIVELLAELSRNPWLVAIWLGPVVWIGVAGFEELWKAFVLRRLWRVWPGPVGRWASLLVVSALFGVGHGYQGPAAIVSIALQTIVMGWLYMLTGRIRALIVAHAVYDSIQVLAAVVAIRAATA